MNKKSQTIIVSLMVAVMIFILVVILSPALMQSISEAKNTTELNESNPNLSIENKATVITLDMTLFYFIGILVAASLAYITGKKTAFDVITAIVVFILVSVLISPLKNLIILARDADHLYCANAALSTGNSLACIVVDIWLFYLVVMAVSVAISYIFIAHVMPRIGEGNG